MGWGHEWLDLRVDIDTDTDTDTNTNQNPMGKFVVNGPLIWQQAPW